MKSFKFIIKEGLRAQFSESFIVIMVGLDVTSGTYYEQNVFYLHSMFNSTSNLITVNEHMNVIMHFEYIYVIVRFNETFKLTIPL